MSITDQALIDLREAMLAMTDIANDNMPNARKVTKGATLTIMERSLARTKDMPTSLRQHLAFRDLSDYISISQKNKSNLARPLNTDLLPVCNPMSTREHALTAAALRHSEARWLASDPRITDDEARTLLASALTSAPFSDDRAYYATRLSALPQGVIPLEALIAGLGDGNSTAARRARAQLQRRDSEGKFAWQGGGLSALIRRANGAVYNLSGRMIGQGIDSDDTFDMELPDGRIARVPAQASKSSKAYLPTNETPDGFGRKPAKYSSSDPVINESDIEYVEAPQGFTKDTNYSGPGARFSDDYYSVIRYDAGDPNTPADNGTDPSKPTFQISRVNDDGTETLLGYADNWSGAQDGIRADQPKRDAEEGRSPDPVAVLPDENGDLPEDVTPEPALEPTPTDEPASAPIAAMEWDVDPRAWNVRRDGYTPRGRRNQASEDYTDDPADLALDFDEEELSDALKQAVIPEDDFSDATGVGQLRFSEGDEDVPAAALYQALREQGVDADAALARAYDEMNGNTNNMDALAKSRGQKPEIAQIPDETPALDLADLPEAMQGMTSEEFAKYQEDGDYTPYLLENQDIDFPDGYSYLDLDPAEPLTDEDRAAGDLPDVVDTNPVNIAMAYDKDDLLDQLRQAVEPNSENPGYGQLSFDDGSPEGFVANVTAETLRDALQLQGVDTNGFLQNIANEGYAGQESDLDESEAGKILAELDGTPESMDSVDPAAQEKRDALADLAAEIGIDESIVEALRNTDDPSVIMDEIEADPAYQSAKDDFDTRMYVDLPRRVQQQDWDKFERLQKLLNPQPTPEAPIAEISGRDSTLDPMPDGPPADPRNPFSPNNHWMWIDRNPFIPGDTDRWALTPRGQAVKDRLDAKPQADSKPKKKSMIEQVEDFFPSVADRPKYPTGGMRLDPELQKVLDDIAKDVPGLDPEDAKNALENDEWADMPERTGEPDDMPDEPVSVEETPDPALDEAISSLESAASAAGVDVPEVATDDQNPQMAKVLALVQAMQQELDRLQAEVVELRAQQQVVPEETSSKLLEISSALDHAGPSLNSVDRMQLEFDVLDNHGNPRPSYLPEDAFAIETVDQAGVRYQIYAVPRADGRLGYDVKVWNTDTGESAVYGEALANRPTEVEDLIKEIRDNVMWSDDPDYNLSGLDWQPPAGPESPLNEMIPSYLQLPPDALGVYHHIKSGHDGNYYAVYAVPNGDGTFSVMLRREDDGSVAFLREVNSRQEALDNTQMIAEDLVYDGIEPSFYNFTNPNGSSPDSSSPDSSSPDSSSPDSSSSSSTSTPGDGMFVPVRVITAPDGKNYEIEIHVDGNGKYVVTVRDANGNTVNVGVFDDAAAANIQQNHMADLIGQNANLNIAQMIRAANRARPDAEEGVNPHVMPERLGEGGEGRIRGRGRRAANGANNNTPMIPILDKLRDRVRAVRNNDAMQRARSQMKKYFSGWDTRGNNHPRPTHEILSRPIRPEHFDANYLDMDGRVIRNGDIVVHNRAGEMVNPDWEAVNLIKGRVVDRGSIWRNGKRHDGYLTVEVIDSDNDEWNGSFFTYKSNMVEIIEQPDMKASIEEVIAARGPNAKELLNQSMWNADDKELHQMWGIMQTLPDNDPLKVALEREMYKRWLVPPQGMADYLNWVSDEGLAAIPDDIAMKEGFNGLVLRRLVANERARRAAGRGPNDPVGPLPEDLFLDPAPGEAIETHPNLRPENPNPPANPNPGGRAPMPQPAVRPIPRPRPRRPARPAPGAPAARPAAAPMPQPVRPSGPDPFVGEAGELPPLDPRMPVERFIPADGSGMGTAGSVASDPNTAGMTVPAGGTDIHPDALNPNASQLDYVEKGWADKRAAEIAEAARTRMSTKALVDLITRKEGITKGDIVPNDPGEVLDLEARIQSGIREIYGDTGTLSGGVKIEFSRVSVYYPYGSDEIQITISGRLSGPNGASGSISRDLYLNVSGDNSKSHAHNSIFTLKDANGNTLKGAGVSDPYNRWMENWYAANGIAYVDVEAHGLPGGDNWIGGARWALNGFQWEDSRSAERNLDGLEDYISNMQRNGEDPKAIERAKKDFARLKSLMKPYEDWNRAGRVGPAPSVPSPLKFVMVGWRPGMFKNWTGWNYMSDVIWNGKKEIRPDTSNAREMVGYEDVYRVSRERIKAQENVFQGAPEFTNMFGEEAFYADPAQHIIAPYRDEIQPFFNAGAPLSLARLSPPARQSLQVWAARFVETDRNGVHAQDTVNLLSQLRDEAAAYDNTPKDLGPNEALLLRVTPQDLRDANNGGFLMIGRQTPTKFIAKRLGQGEELPGGIMETYLVTDTETGQKFFMKTGNRGVMENEENMNALARAFGMRGASIVRQNAGGDIVINTHAGHGVRGAESPNLAGTTQSAYAAAHAGSILGLSQGMVDFMRRAPIQEDMQKALDNDAKWRDLTNRANTVGGMSNDERQAYMNVRDWLAALRHKNSRFTGAPATGGAADAPARIDDTYTKADRIGFSDLTAMALLDAVAHNTDRHDSNWLIADVGVPTQAGGTDLSGRERFVPLAIDHGFSGISDPRYLNAVDDDLINNGTGSSAIRLWAERMNRLSTAHRVAAVRLAATTAMNRMAGLRPAGMSDTIYDTVMERLQILASMSDADLARLRA